MCHYNGAGGGALSDYGRGLFAVEIAARPFWNKKISDDELSAQSGFLGSTPLPWWIRPGAKYRGLWFQVDPGSSKSTERFVQMQADFNTVFLLDQKQNDIIVFSLGYVPEPHAKSNHPEADRNLISHEYYWRHKISGKSFLYLGFLDKVFGLRIPDHTAFSRREVGVGQQDQTHGILFQSQAEDYEYFLGAFAGNLEQISSYRTTGVSAMVEKDIREKLRLGSGLLLQKNEYVQQSRAEVHTRIGLSGGHSILAELGYMNDNPEVGASFDRAYAFVQGMLRLDRGVHLLSTGQYYKKQLDSSNTDQFRWGFALDYYPMQRVEWRTDLINSRSISPTGAGVTSWSIQSQLHLSL